MSDPRPLHIEPAAWLDHFAARSEPARFTPWRSSEEEPAPVSGNEELEVEEEAVEADPVALHADGFAQGFEEGRRTVQLEFADERAALARLTESLDVLRPEPTTALAALLAETVERLVRQIVGRVEVDAILLANRAGEAAALIGEELEPSKLFVHPDDIPLLAPAHIPVELAPDATLARGSVKLECASGWIEDGPSVRLDRLRAALDRMGAPE
jgi:flagellar assembly protein FliH